jgi:hypothetical protein
MSDVLQNLAYMAYIRWYNQKNQCKLSFKNLDFTHFFRVQNGKIAQDSKMTLDLLNQRSRNTKRSLTNEEIDIFIRINQTDDLFNLCNGHDATALIALILEDKTKENISRKNYCDVLRECFQLNHFMQTRLYGNLLSWQRASGFDMLKADPGAANG